MHADRSTPFVDIDLPLPDRRDGKVRVSYALGRRPAPVRHHRPAVGVRPHHRRRALQGPGAQPAGGVVVRPAPPTSSPTTSSTCPTRTCSIARARHAAAGRGGRARLHHRRHRHVAVAAVRRRRAHDLRPRLPRRAAQEHAAARRPIVTPTTKAEHGGHDEPLTLRRGRRARASSTPTCGSEVQAAALALFARGQEVAATAGLILADTKYEFGVDRRRRAAADRRGAHARLVALLGGRHLRGAPGRRRGAGEPRQGGRAPGVRRRRLHAATATRPALPAEVVDRHHRPATSTPTNGSPATPFVPGRLPGRRPHPTACVAGACEMHQSTSHAVTTSPIARPDDDRPHEECGVLGISTPHGDGVAQLAFFGLFALQHRGQEAAGIAVSDGSRARVHKDSRARRPTCSRPRRWRRSPATTRSATPATRTTGVQRRAQHPAVPGRDDARPAGRSPTTATSSTRRRCATSCSAAASGSPPRATPR